MTTREEIEAAAKRRVAYLSGSRQQYPGGFIQREGDGYTIADAYLSERAERQRRIEAAADKIKDGVFGNCRCGECMLRRDFIRDIITRCLDGDAT